MARSILDKNARYHIRLIAGNNDNVFICDDLVSRNFDEYLHYWRVSDDFYKRRSGVKYLKSIFPLAVSLNWSN